MADFAFHLTDWVSSAPSKTSQPVLPEVAKLHGTHVLCIYGREEANSLCKQLAATVATVIAVPGDHHFVDGNYPALAGIILRAAHRTL